MKNRKFKNKKDKQKFISKTKKERNNRKKKGDYSKKST